MDCPPDRFTELMKDFPPHSFLVGLSSIYWREAWKYGERAFRYCQHDAGHAIGALRIAAAALGWRMMVLHGTSDDTIETLLGLNRTEDYESAEREDPEMLAVIWPYDSSITPNIPLHLDPSAMAPLSGAWHGKANRLSVENPVAWDIIPAVAAASWKTTTETMRVLSASVPRFSTDLADRGPVSAGEIIHRRRSAVDFDGKTAISVATFFGMQSAWPLCARQRSCKARSAKKCYASRVLMDPAAGLSGSTFTLSLARGRCAKAGDSGELPSRHRRRWGVFVRHGCGI